MHTKSRLNCKPIGAAIHWRRHIPLGRQNSRSDYMIGSERTCPGVAAFDLQRRVLDAELFVQ